MKAKLIVATLTFIAGFSMYAIAGDKGKHINLLHAEGARTVMVNIDKEDDGEARVKLKINGDSYTFDLPELADGETREVVTEEGQTVTLIKKEKGTSVNVGGEEIMLHSMGGLHTLDGAGHGRVAKIFALKGMDGIHDDNNIVITASGLDDDARSRIKDALASAGIDKKVIFAETNMQWFDDGGGEFEVIMNGEGGEDEHVIKIHKKIQIETDENDS